MPRCAPARATLASRAPAAISLAAAALVLLAPPVGSRRALAKVTVQGTGTATAGWSDNILSAPDQPTVGVAPRESDVLFQLIPGAVLSQAAPRLTERLAYVFTADLFARHSEANSYSNQLDWLATLLTSATTRLSLGLQSQQGRISTFAINQPSSAATITVLAQNNGTNYFSQRLTQSFEATPTPSWRVGQGADVSAFVPIDRGKLADTYSVAANVGVDRTFRFDALGLALRANFVYFAQPRDPMTDVPLGFDSRQVLTTLVARWRRDWSKSWSTEADLGVVSIVGVSADPAATTLTAWEPSALAAVRWFDDLGTAELHYAHSATPNTLAGNTLAADEVALQAGVPLLRAKLFLGATVAYQHARILPLAPGVIAESADLVIADVTVAWQPLPELRLFARYALFDQFGTPPMNGVRPILPDLTRNVVLIGADVIYPALAAVRAPMRGTSRVDESDQQAASAPRAEQPR
ncbi:MAG: hypothetical protein JWM53_2796 [bacterium]|nr:hypothetical protein [bacterium]